MSYLAIARKYRPATFAEIIGQEHVVRTLQNALSSGRIHHAYLFCGARGVGKTTAARALAKALNCVQGPTASPCGVCVSCLEIAAGRAPDLVEIDGASNNSVDDVRELRDTVNYAPVRGRYKIYLVDEVHMLSKAAFNALLKTLEEPPPHVVFIFATTEPNRILETILSRVQRFDFKRIGVQPVAGLLARIAEAEGAVLSQAALRMIARAGEGSMRDAQSLLDKVISSGSALGSGAIDDAAVAETLGLVDRASLLDFTEGMLKGEPDKCLEVIERVYNYGYELSDFTTDLLELLRNATFLRLSPGARIYVDASADELSKLQSMVEGIAPDVLTRLFNALLDVHDQVSRAARPRIVLEMAVARLATTKPVEPVSGLLTRLEELERKLRTPAQGSARPPPRPAREVSTPKKRKAEPSATLEAPPPLVPVLSDAIASANALVPPVALSATPGVTPSAASPRAKPSKAPSKSSSAKSSSSSSSGDDPGFLDGLTREISADSPAERWKSLAPALRAAEASRLVEAQASLRGKTLVLALPAGRALAEGRRARGIPQVEGLIRRVFPQVETIVVEPAAGTGTLAEHQRALQQQVLEHPELRRIVQKLGAELESVNERDDEG